MSRSFGRDAGSMSGTRTSSLDGEVDRMSNMSTRTEIETSSNNPESSDLDKERVCAWNSAPLVEVQRCIHEIIQEEVVAHPEAEAICTEDGIFSYKELDRFTSQLAQYLAGLGVGPNHFVPLCFDKSLWNVVSMIAVLKAGAAFVPFDPAAPIPRLAALVSSIGAKLMLCSQNHAGMLNSVSEMIIPVDGKMIGTLPTDDRISLPVAKETDPAYIIFTSGSTGEPKGTLIEHSAFCSGVAAHGPAMLITSKSRVLQFAAHTFDASLVEILTTLMIGGVVCIPSEERRLNSITAVINEMRVNWAVLTPSFVGFINPAEVPGLETLVLAGEAMSNDHIEKWSHINLVNGYGPSECSVAAVVNSHVIVGTRPTNIGTGTGAHLWIVDPYNHELLVPVGCVGELLVQGPTLARCYYNDPQKTAEVFISSPAWATMCHEEDKKWRIYKTGDLVRQNDDGTLDFVGRKDTQVKVHGQRVELGEIEHHINVQPEVNHCIVLLPKTGHFHGRLISVVSLSEFPENNESFLKLREGPLKQAKIIRDYLSSRLPIHMVPSMMIIVEAIPRLASGKLDRKRVANWVQNMAEEQYWHIVDIAESERHFAEKNKLPATEIESRIRLIWSRVLNLDVSQIDIDRSFMSLGGDSISAMQVKAHCSKKDISLTVQDILRSKSITQLALCVKDVGHQLYEKEILEENFNLSPIQSLYFNLPGQGQGHFNQSFFLRVTRTIEKKDLRLAIETIVDRHSMLRARFTKSETDNSWYQRITADVTSSYRLKTYDIKDQSQTTAAIADSQTSLNAVNGPMFAADLFSVNGSHQLLFMVGHHLVIDLVSWRIILEDIEELLSSTQICSAAGPSEKPLSFQTWTKLQVNHSQKMNIGRVLPSHIVPNGDSEYWGIDDCPNTYGDVVRKGFEVDTATTTVILTQCHGALKTEPIDILLSTLINSFAQVFTDRSVPPIYNEGHGRESTDIGVDLSRTVGWFTIMYPVHVAESAARDPVETVRQVKDLRRQIPGNGRPYFASRCLTDEGRQRFGGHWPLQITFNYLGVYQQLEREGGLLRPVHDMAGEARGAGGTADVGENTPRFGLFEISAVIVQGKLRFSFTFNRRMKHQDKIMRWILACQQTVGMIAERLTDMIPEPTISDFPLLSLTNDGLQTIVKERLPRMCIFDIEEVAEIYPCSSMQEGLLISRTKVPEFYAVQVICGLKCGEGIDIDTERLAAAWQQVVNRHASLRTVFMESVSRNDGLYDQLVLKNVVANIVNMDCCSEGYALKKLGEKNFATFTEEHRPPHRFTICKTNNGKALCKLEISHAIMDGDSMSIIFREIAAGYEGTLPSGLGPLYSEYIEYLQHQTSDTSVEYWKSYLSNVEPCTFPTLNDGLSATKELRSLRLGFTNSQFRELQTFCDKNGLTLSNIFHTAWALTLRCYTGADDTCFGYLTSGRDAPVEGIQNAVGPFINMLVCRVNMVPASRLGAILDQVQKDYMDSIPHRDTSLAEIQHALQLSGTALFNTALSYRRLPAVDRNSIQKRVELVELGATYDPTEYSISLNIEASEINAIIDLDYWTDYISDGQASNVANTFMQSLHNIVHYAGEMIENLDQIGDYHLKKVLEWNSNMPEAIEDCVHEVIKKQTTLQPSHPAVCAWDAEFTYTELDDLSTRLSHHLVAMGVEPETNVPTCFDKSAWTVVAMLAVLKAGAAAVPLDANHPKSALELRVRDTQAKLVLSAPVRTGLFEDMDVEVVSISQALLDQLPSVKGDACKAVGPRSPCFLIFTSGSTGVPKGVVLEHRAIVTSGHATGTAYDLGPDSRVLQFAAYTFDNSLTEIFTTLMCGGCVCVPSEHDRFNNLAEAINRLDVNFMDITPTVASFLRPSDVPKVRGLSLGGEPLTRENIEVWGKAVQLHCCYGPSECSINSTWNGDLTRSSEATNIGKSIGSVSWVVDALNHNRLVPIGCVGELLIEGPILAKCYLNDPDKTSNSFIFNPTWAKGDDDRRMYKTGDLVRYNSDGSITYLGRKDTQVKLNGQRIELGEIEHHIKANLPSDSQSAVELITMSGGHKSTKALGAFLRLGLDTSVSTSGQDGFLVQMTEPIRSTACQLGEIIKSALPAYMVPTIYIPITTMPMTSSGKLDRRKLRMIGQSLSEEQIAMYRLARKSGRKPSSEMEKHLAELWESVLRIDAGTIEADDNFFRLGGDSIGAMKLITAARLKGISLSVANIFQKPKLSDLSLDATKTSGIDVPDTRQTAVEPFSLVRTKEPIDNLIEEVASYCRVATDSVEDIYKCTSIQEGLIALSNRDPGAYVAQNIYRLPANIDVARFRQSWQNIVEAEVILRTRIVYTKTHGFLQVVVREPLEWHTATDLQSIVGEDRHLPAHNGGRLSRYAIVEEIGSDPHFVWTSHHALYDGWCIPLILERVQRCYQDLKSVDKVLGSAYPRFIKYLSGIDNAKSDEFWRSKLAGVTAAQFPPLPHPAYQFHSSSTATHTTSILREAGSHITLPSKIRAAWALVLSVYSGCPEDVIFGEAWTGRDAPVPDIADIIGPTLATVPTRVRLNPDISIARFLEDVQSQSAEAIPFQYAGLQRIKRLSEDAGIACGFQNLLAVNHAIGEPTDQFWDLRSSGTIGTNFFSYPLIVSCQLGHSNVVVDAHYDKDVISPWLVDRMLLQFEFFLDCLNSSSMRQCKLGQINLLNTKDRATILNWNSEPLNTSNECVHDLIQKQVRLQPDSTIAVDSWDAAFTYRDLDELSTHLAHNLFKQGIQGRLVPLCFEKSAWTVVAMLAVMKSGGAFVPLDPAAPVARLRDILSDTKADLVLCSHRYQKLCEGIAPRSITVDRSVIEHMSNKRVTLPSVDSADAAYVIFTSGTTGKPKGTIIQHGAFCAGAAAHGPTLRMQSSSRVLQFASYTFDASLLEILTTLTLGGCVCVPSDEARMNHIEAVINDMNITWTILTPSFVQLLQPSTVPTLRTLVLGGEAMSESHISTWADKLELINAYGPSECAVVATANPHISLSTDPNNMGRAVGGRAWIIDALNSNRLVPVGSVGELVIEGPILAKGYLNNDSKTSEVFIENPPWVETLCECSPVTARRMYRTGDLAKYASDGSLVFCGRKDTQVKLHGQRLELSEVEHHLKVDPSIRHVLTTIPKAGFCTKRLVAVVSLQELASTSIENSGLKVVVRDACSFYLSGIRGRLCENLPAYMIPSNWVVLHKLPLQPSGKLDRRQIEKWVEDMDSETYHQISDVVSVVEGEAKTGGGTVIEKQLRQIWGNALNLPSEQIGLNQSFLHLGGDSISAMQVMSTCRAQGLGVTVQDIIQCKSISQLALRATLPEELIQEVERIEEVFDLSPIQKLYFENVGDSDSHFNQSVMVQLTRRISSEGLKNATKALVSTHSMLRARFNKNEAEKWQQRVIANLSNSYQYETITTSLEQLSSHIDRVQKSLDIESGPTFAVSLFEVDKIQLLLLVAHHLVVDVVSWRVILQDLETFCSGTTDLVVPLSFQTWSNRQVERAHSTFKGIFDIHDDIPVADISYWGMTEKSNKYGDIIDSGFEIDAATTLQLLGTCHESLQTEPVDIFLAAILQSFHKVFPDRQNTPAIYNEGHGRESWAGSKLDLSRTVGWFTTMCPIAFPSTMEDEPDLLNTIRWVKDLRRRVLDKGRPYFAYRMLTEQGGERFSSHWPMEVTFNYLGRINELERKDSLFRSFPSINYSNLDIGQSVPRFALFEISAAVENGTIKMSFSYNRHMKRQAKIRRWAVECQKSLQEAAKRLIQQKPERTLCDFPLLALSYRGVANLLERLPQLGVRSLEDIEDVYPTSPTQNGMLLAQLKNPHLYAYSAIFEARSPDPETRVDPRQLAESWQSVVQRHATLRTVFIDSICRRGLNNQVVLKDKIARIAWLECEDSCVLDLIKEQPSINFRDVQPPHRFTLCKTDGGRVFCKLEISHTISDGTSIPILLRDLSAAYLDRISMDCFKSSHIDEGSLPQLPSIGPLYSEYVAHIQSASPDEDINYWKAYLSGIEPCHLTSLNDGIKEGNQLKSLVLQVSDDLELRTFCNSNGITLSNILQFVWGLVLKSYTGSGEVCFGYLTSGRDAPIQGIQDSAVGAFINMLTCRLNLNDRITFGKALESIQTDFIQGMTHQSCSLADVQHELGLSGTSLFNTAFTYQKRSPSNAAVGTSISFDILDAQDPSEYDVTVNVEALDTGIEIHFGYWTASICTAQATNLVNTFEHVLNMVVSLESLDQALGDLDYFSEGSREQVMYWNKTLPETVDKCVHEMIDGQRLKQPISASAVCAWDLNLTYTELDELATSLAQHLVNQGVRAEVYVPLCFEKSGWAVVAMLAVMKAGGAFVPLDYTHPQSRLKQFICDVNADLVLCSGDNFEKISGATKRTFVVNESNIRALQNSGVETLLTRSTPSDPAYIIFTSGTTGRPKGTIVEHGAFCTSATEHTKAMCLTSSSRVLQFASYTFDASIMEILSTLVVGGCVCIPSDQDRLNDIPGVIKRMGVTWTLLTPSVANTLSPKSVPDLRVLVTGGEAMSSGHCAKWRSRLCLINAYGPSETSVIASTSTKVDMAGNELNNDPSNIGQAVGGRTWIINPNDCNRLVPVGAIGELAVEGRIVARGYLNNNQKTAESFIHPAWLEGLERKERVYRTGDLVRYNSDGTLSFVTRKDTQIKLNGQRIELGEIEHHIKVILPEDAQSAVDLVAPASRLSTKALAVFFCLQSTTPSSMLEDCRISGVDEILLSMSNTASSIAKNLDSSLAAVLPTYMIPTFYIPVVKMPWTSSGKLDRSRLRAMVQSVPTEIMAAYRLVSVESKSNKAPTTPLEKKLQQLWEVVLNIATPGSVGVEDSFFRLGGDSVTAMRLVGAARAEKILLTVMDIFRNPRLCDMALICSTLEEDAIGVEMGTFALLNPDESVEQVLDEVVDQCRVDSTLILDALPCSLLQEGLITLSIKQPGAYVAQNVFKLLRDVDIDRFKAAWQRTVNEVDILRTRIVHMKSSSFLQVVLQQQPIEWHTALSLDEITAVPAKLPSHNGGDLTRYTIVQDSHERYFVWSIHHALYDGWSLPMILKRVEMIYKDNDPGVRSSYGLFIKYLSEIDKTTSDQFWRSRLSDATSLQFPQKQHAVGERTTNFQTLIHVAPISRNTASMGITLPTIVRAAWSLVVSAYSGSNDVVFGETLAGRDIPVQGVTDIIGPIFTTVPTRVQVDRGVTVTNFLNGIQKMATDIIPFQHVGLQRIKGLDDNMEIVCDFQNLLVIQTAEEEMENGFWDLQGSGMASNFFTYPLVLEVRATSDKVDINAHYDEMVISTWQMQRILFQLGHALGQLSDLPKIGTKTKLNVVEIFGPQDKELVQGWNSKTLETVDSCIHEEFEEMALTNPHAPAICSWDHEFTYTELKDHSMRLASHLMTLGVEPEVLVPICMDKSAWVIVAMMGIMMAGGAYVPLDPIAPPSRHQEMIDDVRAAIIVCAPQHSNRFANMVKKRVIVDEETIYNLPEYSDQSFHRATSKNAAYCLFTSGSSGKPKGTLIEHRAIVTNSAAMAKALQITSSSRVFQFASYTFDASVLETLTVLTQGGCICIPSEDQRTSDVASAINGLNATWTLLTPSVAGLIEPTSVPSLTTLVCGGEAMSTENVQRWAGNLNLINAYGPTESSVVGTTNDRVNEQRDPSNIGTALQSVHTWIVDSEDYNRICPVGCVGELLLDGPILARGYINNELKTAEAFAERPLWAMELSHTLQSSKSAGRVYKTGDLVKYNQDGSLTYIGRKDNQVKLHGQRMELGEIEHSLDKISTVQHALVSIPKSGPFRKRLVALVSLRELLATTTAGSCQLILDGPRASAARAQTVNIRNQLADILPPYMVPSFWLVVEAIPLQASGKLDRRNVEAWLQNIDNTTYERILEAEEEEENAVPATETSRLLQKIFSQVLNLPLQRVRLGKSFLSLGGDSISAMRVMALCRKENINFSLTDVLKSKSIHQLASVVRYGDEIQHQEEVIGQSFTLSPIQQLYFQTQSVASYGGDARFNQSFSLEITKRVQASQVEKAISLIVDYHSMIRARFSYSASESWVQQITLDSASAYHCRVHCLESAKQIIPIVALSQASLDIECGPVFVADLFELADGKQMIFMAAHHLVIDMVSWRVILQDLEEFLTTGELTSHKPLSFQVWCAMQQEHALKFASQANVLPFELPPTDLKYWGIDQQANTYQDVVCETFIVDERLTDLALGKCNEPLRTDPVEIFLSAIAHSFSRVFVDRRPPAVFNENHGREAWDSSIDLSRTVGWFTTIFPIFTEIDMDNDDVVETVRRMKDTRRSVPDNGRPYFAHRFLNPEGKVKSSQEGPAEILFNYLGRMQQIEKDDSLLQQWNYPEDDEVSKLIADVGPKAARLALFEVSAAVVRNKIQFSFLYSSRTKHQQDIQRWISECHETLEEIVERLSNIETGPSLTLSDFPLLPISYEGLQKIITKSLPEVGITQDDVEDIFPASSLQEGLLISQLKDPSLYHFHAVFEVDRAQADIPVDGKRLAHAWQMVVDRHGALRTVFADSVYKGDVFNQIIVKQVDSGVILLKCEESEALETLGRMNILEENYRKKPRLPHQAIICETSAGKVYFKAEINHAVIDGASANLMLVDLAAAYHGTLPDGPGPLYSDYVAFIKTMPPGIGAKFWKTHLEGARTCHFPAIATPPQERKLAHVVMRFARFPEVQEMCKKMSLTFANVMMAAWAFCLRHHTKSEDVCFGYLTSGRDVPVKGIQTTIGAFINMLVCRVKFSKQSSLKEVFQKVQNDYLLSLEHQHISLAQVQHDLMGGRSLFNTAVSIQRDSAADHREEGSISFEPVTAHDPSEYAITINIRTLRDDEGVVIRYWNDIISAEQADELSQMLARVMENFITNPHQQVEELNISQSVEYPPDLPVEPKPIEQALWQSEAQLRSIVTDCVREVIQQMFKSGALVSYDQQKIDSTVNQVTTQTIQPMIDYSQLSSPPPRSDFQRSPSAIIQGTTPAKTTDVEQKLLSVWSDLLQISEDSISRDDSFFQLGGDSIIAMQMVGAARDEDLALTVANIFRHPNFADMAAVIRLAEEATAPQDINDKREYDEAREARSQAIQNALYQRYSLLEAANVDAFLQENICPKVGSFRGGIVDVFPVTDFQALAVTGTLMESKWMLNYFYLEGKGDLDLKRLKNTISRLVHSFDILRTVFVPYGNRFFQVVLRKLQPSFEVHETDNLAEFTCSLQQRDRENGPRLGESYLQFTVAKLRGSRVHRIIIRMSHAQYDGVCIPRILGALQVGYKGHNIPSTPSFSTYVRDAARRTTDDYYIHWKTLLKGSSLTEVVRRHGPNYSRGTEAPITLKRIIHIVSLAAENITPATFIKSAWSFVLARHSATSDVTFGNVISGRNAAVLGVESIIGPCVNLIPVRIKFQDGWTILDLLRYVQDQQVTNMAYESLGFREIIKHCTNWPDWSNFSTVCQHQNIQRQTEMELGGNEYTLGAVGSQEDFADLTVVSTPQGDDNIEISLIFTSNSGITRSFADDIFESLCVTLEDFSADLKAPLPTPQELSSLQPSTLEASSTPMDSALSSDLSRDEILIYSEILVRAWRQILWDQTGQSGVIELETSFYELGGDIIGLAQVASLLEQEGFKLRVEDLVDHPVMLEQLALLALCSKKEREREEAEAGKVPATDHELVSPPPKKRLMKIFGKPAGFMKKIRQRKLKGNGQGGAKGK